MLSHLQDGSLMLLKLQIFLLDLIDSDTDNIDHISEDSCAYNFDHGDNNSLDIVVRCEIPVTNSYHCCIRPIIRVNIVNIPGLIC